jgi:hypothetical protein
MKIIIYKIKEKQIEHYGQYYVTFTLKVEGGEITLGTGSKKMSNFDPGEKNREFFASYSNPFQKQTDQILEEVKMFLLPGKLAIARTKLSGFVNQLKVKGLINKLIEQTEKKIREGKENEDLLSELTIVEEAIQETLEKEHKEQPKPFSLEARLSDEENIIDETDLNLDDLEENEDLNAELASLKETNFAMSPFAKAAEPTQEELTELKKYEDESSAEKPASDTVPLPEQQKTPQLQKLFASVPTRPLSGDVPENFRAFTSEDWKTYWSHFEYEKIERENLDDIHSIVCKKLKIQPPIPRNLNEEEIEAAEKDKLKEFHEVAARVPPEEYKEVFQNAAGKQVSMSLDAAWKIYWKYFDKALNEITTYDRNTILPIHEQAILRLGFIENTNTAIKVYFENAHLYAAKKSGQDLKNHEILKNYKKYFSQYIKASLNLKNLYRDATQQPIKKLEKFGTALIPKSISDKYGKKYPDLINGYRKNVLKIEMLLKKYNKQENDGSPVDSFAQLNNFLLDDETYKSFGEVYFYYQKLLKFENESKEKIDDFPKQNIIIQAIQLLPSSLPTYKDLIEANEAIENKEDAEKLTACRDICAEITDKMNEHIRNLEMVNSIQPLKGGNAAKKKKKTSTKNINESLKNIQISLTEFVLNFKLFETQKIGVLKLDIYNLIDLLLKKIEKKSTKKSKVASSDITSLLNNFSVLIYFAQQLSTDIYDPKPHLERINTVLPIIIKKTFTKEAAENEFTKCWETLQSEIVKQKEKKEKQVLPSRTSISSSMLSQKPFSLFPVQEESSNEEDEDTASTSTSSSLEIKSEEKQIEEEKPAASPAIVLSDTASPSSAPAIPSSPQISVGKEEKLLSLGENYWKDFSENLRTRQKSSPGTHASYHLLLSHQKTNNKWGYTLAQKLHDIAFDKTNISKEISEEELGAYRENFEYYYQNQELIEPALAEIKQQEEIKKKAKIEEEQKRKEAEEEAKVENESKKPDDREHTNSASDFSELLIRAKKTEKELYGDTVPPERTSIDEIEKESEKLLEKVRGKTGSPKASSETIEFPLTSKLSEEEKAKQLRQEALEAQEKKRKEQVKAEEEQKSIQITDWDTYWKTFGEIYNPFVKSKNYNRKNPDMAHMVAHTEAYQKLYNGGEWDRKLLKNLHFIADFAFYSSLDSSSINPWDEYHKDFQFFYQKEGSIETKLAQIKLANKEQEEKEAAEKLAKEKKQAEDKQRQLYALREEEAALTRKKTEDAQQRKEEKATRLKKEPEQTDLDSDKENASLKTNPSEFFSKPDTSSSQTTTSSPRGFDFLEPSIIKAIEDIYTQKSNLSFEKLNNNHAQIKSKNNPKQKIEIYKDKMSVDVPDGSLSQETKDLLTEMADAVMAAIEKHIDENKSTLDDTAKAKLRTVWVKGSNTASVNFLTQHYQNNKYIVVPQQSAPIQTSLPMNA